MITRKSGWIASNQSFCFHQNINEKSGRVSAICFLYLSLKKSVRKTVFLTPVIMFVLILQPAHPYHCLPVCVSDARRRGRRSAARRQSTRVDAERAMRRAGGAVCAQRGACVCFSIRFIDCISI